MPPGKFKQFFLAPHNKPLFRGKVKPLQRGKPQRTTSLVGIFLYLTFAVVIGA